METGGNLKRFDEVSKLHTFHRIIGFGYLISVILNTVVLVSEIRRRGSVPANMNERKAKVQSLAFLQALLRFYETFTNLSLDYDYAHKADNM